MSTLFEQEKNIADYTENITDKAVIKNALYSKEEEAKEILEDADKTERMLQKIENKVSKIPGIGKKLCYIPTFISMIGSYINKEYRDIPIGSVISVVSSLLYFLAPIDLVADVIPVLGYLDDAAVMTLCWDLVSSDFEDYIAWREINKNN